MKPNVLIPMAGRGTRFVNVGYDLPKPLIEIKGSPIIEYVIDSLNIYGNYIFIVQKDHVDHFKIDEVLRRIKPTCSIITTDVVTEGPACSALLAKDLIDNENELVIANCDQIMNWWGAAFLNAARMYDGTVVTYTHNSPKNSYARISNMGFVQEIREKEVISDISLNGIHYWKKGRHFVQSAEEMIEKNDRVNNEFYISHTYNYLIERCFSVGIHHIPNCQHHNVGVPEDFESFIGQQNIDS